jgi:hypothetical protein
MTTAIAAENFSKGEAGKLEAMLIPTAAICPLLVD